MAVITGTSGDDFINGTPGDDQIDGAEGNDTLVGQAGDDELEGGDGNDTLRGDGFNGYNGPSGDDLLSGGDGDDLMYGGAGTDSFNGGAGFDRVSFFAFAATQGAVASLVTQTVLNDGFGNAETMVSIEALGAGTAYADHFTGNDGDNFLLGDRGDTVIGNGGADSFQLGGAPALTDGGNGIDAITRFLGYEFGMLVPDSNGDGLAETVFATRGVHVDLTISAIVDDGFGNSGVVVGVENVGGSTLDDILIGDGENNVLDGFEGVDLLEGGKGDDTLNGGAGNDQLAGGKDDDRLVGGDGDDILSGDQGRDLFEFGTGSGHDRIEDFEKKDMIAIFDVAGVDDISDLTILQVGMDTIISWNGGAASLTLEDFKAKHLSAENFDFGGG